MKKEILSYVIPCLIGVAIYIGLMAGVIVLCNFTNHKYIQTEDITYKEQLIQHQAHCSGHCTFKSASEDKSYMRYTYFCDKCGEVFLFYDWTIPQKILYN